MRSSWFNGLCGAARWARTHALPASAEAQRGAKVAAGNIVLVHGLFADGSCWSDVIGKLQATGLNVVSWPTT
jgi:hypothetical protein